MESFASTLGHLRRCPDHANKTFKQKSAEFVKMEAENPHIKKRMIFAVTGEASGQVLELMGDVGWKTNRLGAGSDVSLEILDLQSILSRMTAPYTPALKISFDGSVIERTDPATGKKSVIGHIGANSLVRLAKEHKETLFLANPRQTLGSAAPTHKAILHTLSDPNARQRFWKLNNGITATCTDFVAGPDSSYMVENFKIVNGRQTTYALEESAHPLDDVLLLLTMHEASDDDERGQISEATNTQNPVKPADLVTNYPEMTELVLQCRRDYPEFYFERQTRGFKSAKRSTQNRVTARRVLEKNAVARAYYAYAINPKGATMPEKALFTAEKSGHYDEVFADRNVRDLIIPHIFVQSLDELHRLWCRELRENPSDETARKKGIISKDSIKYYMLRFICESMMCIDEGQRAQVKNNMIRSFREIKHDDPIPEAFLNVARSAYRVFVLCFNMDRTETWPKDLLRRINSNGYREQAGDVPSPYDMVSTLKRDGGRLFPHLLRIREQLIGEIGDGVASSLLAFKDPR